MRQTSPLPLRVTLDTSLVPTNEEFQESLCLLRHVHEENPEKLIKIISNIYPFVEHRQQNYLQFPQPLRTMLINLYKIPQKRQGISAFYRRVAAKIYCYSGSTYGRLATYCKQYKLKFKTNEMEWRNTILGIIRQAYRSIEERVIKNFSVLDIKVLDQDEAKNFEPILFYLEANMSKQACEVFRREIKNMFNLEKREEIEVTLCYQFYHQLRQKMEARQADIAPQAKLLNQANNRSKEREKQNEKDVFRPNPAYSNYHYDLTAYKEFPKHHHVREDNPQIWTSLVQHQLVALFLELRDLTKVRHHFHSKYGEHPQLTSQRKLKCKFIKIIRGTIRLLQGFYRQRSNDLVPPLPKMMEIDQDKVKLLIGSPYEIKACILEFYRQTTISYLTLCEIISEINVFIMQKSLIRYQKSTVSKAIIFSL